MVANTFIKQWEMKAYRKLAQQYGAKLVIKICSGKYVNIHRVPADTIKTMKQQWQP